MTQTETPTLSQIEVLLAQNGYHVAQSGDGVLQVRDLETGVLFRAALEGNVLYMTLKLIDIKRAEITPEMMRRMLEADNGISTSSFKLYQEGDGKTAITLNNFCTLQNMGPEDEDDVLSLAGYLMADLMEARALLGPMVEAK
jgi:hypothetical protein